MRVKHKYRFSSKYEDMSTAMLIDVGATQHEGGSLEEMKSQIDHLREVVADLIGYAKLSDEEVLRITRADRIYDAVKTRGVKDAT